VIGGLTFDTGILIALERRNHRARELVENALRRALRITVPAAVVTEWWRGRTDVREAILRAVRVEPLSDGLARIAGEALAGVPGATAIDAIVMASAAQRGDIVYTSDLGDLARLAGHFPSVRVLGIG
jgi:predicted nucleic acid-binding protein